MLFIFFLRLSFGYFSAKILFFFLSDTNIRKKKEEKQFLHHFAQNNTPFGTSVSLTRNRFVCSLSTCVVSAEARVHLTTRSLPFKKCSEKEPLICVSFIICSSPFKGAMDVRPTTLRTYVLTP